MGRSAATVFLISFVLGVGAFIGTLLFAPLPRPPAPPVLTPEEQAERDRRRHAAEVVENYHFRRERRIRDGQWELLEGLAREVLAVRPYDLWARIDLLHALERTGADAGEIRGHAGQLLAYAVNAPPQVPRWQVLAATGWARAFLDGPEEARLAWCEAAEACVAPASNDATGWYNRAGYLSLSGDREGALEAWERAVRLGYSNFDYARMDYDLAGLIGEPGFEGPIAAAMERQREIAEAQAAEDARLNAEAEARRAAARAAADAGGSPIADGP